MTSQPGAAVNWRRPSLDPLPPVLASALDAFYANGYHGTSVRDIARGADMTVPGLYYHYDSKQEILVDLLDRSISTVIECSRAAVAEAGDDVGRRFDNLIESMVLFMAHHPKNAAMDAEIRALSPDNRRRYSAKRRTVERLLVRSIEDGQRAGQFRVGYPADTARALLGMIQSIPIWFRPTGRLSVVALAERYVDVARHSVGAG
jgi:AcrR family transcriptional regulator